MASEVTVLVLVPVLPQLHFFPVPPVRLWTICATSLRCYRVRVCDYIVVKEVRFSLACCDLGRDYNP
jgi:hypothetical protein